MKNVRSLSVSLLVTLAILLSGASKCSTKPPQIERCLIGDSGCICFDPRLPSGQREYTLSFKECLNYIATNPDDYMTAQEWCANNKKKAAATQMKYGDPALFQEVSEE